MATYKNGTYGTYGTYSDWDTLPTDSASNSVWRGVPNVTWCMETALDWFARHHQIVDHVGLNNILQTLYSRYLIERVLPYRPDDEHLSALSLPTPYLDWSRSPMAALFSSVLENDPAVPVASRLCRVWRLDSDNSAFAAGDFSRCCSRYVLRWSGSGRSRAFSRRCRARVPSPTCSPHWTTSPPHAHAFPADLSRKFLRDVESFMINDLGMFPDHEGVNRCVITLAGA